MKKRSSRREFVKRTDALVAGSVVIPQILPSSVFGKGGRIAPSDRIVRGSIGTGSQGMSNMRDEAERGYVSPLGEIRKGVVVSGY